MFNPSREQVRRFFCDAWKKYQERLPLAGAEIAAANIAARHPEYHQLLENVEGALDKEWSPIGGQTNPFLHLSLHLAIHEQLSINQPEGIRSAFEKLCTRIEPHEAEHVLIECLGEALWHSQRNNQPMNAEAYLAAIQHAANLP